MNNVPITVTFRHVVLAVISVLFALLATAASANEISVLIVDGFSNHSVENTTRKIQDILTRNPTFKVSVSTMPEFDSEGWKNWDPHFAAYDVIIQTCNNLNQREISWPDKVKAALESFRIRYSDLRIQMLPSFRLVLYYPLLQKWLTGAGSNLGTLNGFSKAIIELC